MSVDPVSFSGSSTGPQSQAQPDANRPPTVADLPGERLDRVLIGADEIQRRVRELGQAITEDYAATGVHVVAVLKGSMMVVADLLRAIRCPVTVDFIAVSSYGPRAGASGTVRVIKDLDQDILGRPVLVVEDVIDTGLTLNYILRILRSRHPASLDVATLLDKPVRRLIDLKLRYVGFTIPDCFVVGYGMDEAGRYRNLPYLATLRPVGGRS